MHPMMHSVATRTLCATAALAALVGVGARAAPAQAPDGGGAARARAPIRLAAMGSFFVGGRQVTGPGVFDPTAGAGLTNVGQTFWIDQLYAQFYVPENARPLPLVLVATAPVTGSVWESTPDGREGFAPLFLRRGYSVYVVDPPRRGRAGFPSFNGPLGNLAGEQVGPAQTTRPGMQWGWMRWRLGPEYPAFFANSQFPRAGVDEFFKAITPIVGEPAVEAVRDAHAALFERIGPAILVTDRTAARANWYTAMKAPNVRAFIAYEPVGTAPMFVFPEGEVPPPIPLSNGATIPAGAPVPLEDFLKLTRIPIQLVYGDNLPTAPVPQLPVDATRALGVAARLFVDAVNRHGGDASILMLPDAGLRGNTALPFQDRNNARVADLLALYLRAKGLDRGRRR